MKTNVGKLFMAAMLMTAAMFAVSCSNSDDSTFTEPQVEPEAPVIHFRAQLGAKNGDGQNGAKAQADAQRRVVTDQDTYLDAAWQVDEEVALIYEVSGVKQMVKATVTEVSGDAAIIEGDLTGSPANDRLR